MKPGDQVRIIPTYHSMVLLDEPPTFKYIDPINFSNNYTKNRTVVFQHNDVGIFLEQRFVGEGDFSPIPKNFWIKILCPNGTGWIKRCDLELVR